MGTSLLPSGTFHTADGPRVAGHRAVALLKTSFRAVHLLQSLRLPALLQVALCHLPAEPWRAAFAASDAEAASTAAACVA